MRLGARPVWCRSRARLSHERRASSFDTADPCAANLQATALVGLQLGSPSPQFCVLLKGELLAALSGQHAFWQAAVLFFMTVQRHAGGMLASVSLDVLGLGEVVHPRAHAQNRDAGRASAQGSRADYA